MRESAPSRTHQLVLLGIVIAATALRLWGLGSWPWEQDELYTLRDARDLGTTANGAPGILGRPVYYLLQHLLLGFTPPTPFFLRLPAAAFGVAGVVAVWWLGRRLFGRQAGLIGAALVAISPWHLYASQFARYWTLVFLLAALTFGVLPRALEADRWRGLAGALALLLVGTFTHPTFLFPLAGAVLALHLVTEDGRIAFRWPTRRAWLALWLPFATIVLGAYITLASTGRSNAIRNWEGRGLLASLRLVPAMLQWVPLEVAAAAAVAALFLLTRCGADRRWAAMSLMASAGALLLLFSSSFFTSIYADYGISCLPLVFAIVGGSLQRVAEAVQPRVGSWVTAGGTAVLALGVAPGTISHLSDGSRFDYRSVYETILKLGPDRPISGDIDVLRQAYAPGLQTLREVAAKAGQRPVSFWLVPSYQRYGVRGASPQAIRWMDQKCRRVMSAERPRLDYRVYRVDLLWCGPDPIPSGDQQ